jgi:hypothetical protein
LRHGLSASAARLPASAGLGLVNRQQQAVIDYLLEENQSFAPRALIDGCASL